jgi:hypothetical protein
MNPSRLVTSGGVRRHTVRGMRKITKAALVGGAAAAAIAATVGLASPANASSSGYLAAVEDVAYGVPTSTQLGVGNGTCAILTEARSSGMSPGAGLASVGMLFLTNGFTPEDAATVVYAAVTELCPSNYSYMMAGATDISGNGGGSLYA